MSPLVRLGERLVPWSDIREIDLRGMEREGSLRVIRRGDRGAIELVGAEAVDLVMRLDPAFFEGRRFRWVRSSWALHNLVGHPLLQLLAWVGHTPLGLRVHDATVPRPAH